MIAMSAKTKGAAALIVAVAGAGAIVFATSKKVTEQAPASATVAADPPTRGAEDAFDQPMRHEGEQSHSLSKSNGCSFDAGQTFALSYQSQTTFHDGQRTKEQRVQGTLTFSVLDAAPQASVLVATFTPDSAPTGEATRDLDAPFLVQINRWCELERFGRGASVAVDVARLQQSLVHELWFSRPEGKASATERFKNAVGEARATLDVDDSGAVTRTVRAYERFWSPDMAGTRVQKSVLRVEQSPATNRAFAPWLSRAVGEQTLVLPGALPSGTSTIKAQAVAAKASDLRDASRDEEDYIWGDLLRPQSRQMAPGISDGYQKRVEAMRNVKFDQALQRFGTLVETKANAEEHHVVMAAYLDAHPENIVPFSKLLAAKLPDNWKPAGYAALQATQNPVAKDALVELWTEERLPSIERVRSSLALAGRLDVGAPLARKFAAASTRGTSDGELDVAKHALLHLGVLAGTHGDDGEVQEIARETLASRLSTADSREELKTTFLAVANTGNTAFLPALQRWSEHSNPDYREVVAIGMRRMPVDDTRAFVAEWLERETSYRVKREIFEVIKRQFHDQQAVLDDALVDQTVAHLRQRPRILTRQSIYRLLTPLAKKDGRVREALREALAFETEKKSNLANYLTQILSPADVDRALAERPSLSDQLRNPAEETAREEPDEDESPPRDLDIGFNGMELGTEPPAVVPGVSESMVPHE